MEFLNNYGLFLAETLTIVIAILAIVGGIIILASKDKELSNGKLKIRPLDKKFKDFQEQLNEAILSKAELKQRHKTDKQRKKAEKKSAVQMTKKRIFIINFAGDMKASAVKNLREEITAILTVAKSDDEILVRLESQGGMMHAYGLAASQLCRIRDKNIRLVIAIDKVAASGGYMMAAVADHIIAAPFAIVGSIGVIAQLPNFSRLLKRQHIDFEQITAGEFKRTLTLFGENTSRGRQKFQQEVDESHLLFKNFIKSYRHGIDIDKVATGEHWFGQQALALNLVDELKTSDDYILAASENANLYEIKQKVKQPLARKLSQAISYGVFQTKNLVWQNSQESRLL